MQDTRPNETIDQPDSHIPGTDFTGSGKEKISHNGGGTFARGVALRAAGIDAKLTVHLIADAADVWFDIDLVAGDPAQGFKFDIIDSSESDVVFDANLIIYPESRPQVKP